MQKSFQCNHDVESAGDHTHKYLKLVKAATRGGDVFTASYTTMILLVHVATSHLTFINSNSEIEPIIQQIGEIRKNCNSGTLLRCETDNVNGDATLWEACFPTILKDA